MEHSTITPAPGTENVTTLMEQFKEKFSTLTDGEHKQDPPKAKKTNKKIQMINHKTRS